MFLPVPTWACLPRVVWLVRSPADNVPSCKVKGSSLPLTLIDFRLRGARVNGRLDPQTMKVDWLAMNLWYYDDPWFTTFWIDVTPGDTTVGIDTTGGAWTNQVYISGHDEYERRFSLAWLFLVTWP